MRFLHKFTLLFSGLVIMSSMIQFIVFDRFLFTATDSLLLETNEKAANNLSEQFLVYFQEIENVLKTIATDETIRENQHLLNKINEITPELDVIVVLDKQGNVFRVSGFEGDVSTVNLSQREYFQQAMKGQTYISDVYKGKSGNQVISVAVPIIENGNVSGAVVGTIRLHGDILASMFDDKSFGRNGVIAVTDKDGNIVYHPNKEFIGQKSVIVNDLQETAGSKIMKNRVGEEQYIGYSRVPGLNWFVSVNTPTAEVTQFRRMMVYEMIAISLVAIFLIISLGAYMVRQFMKPIDQLIDAFSSVKKGKYKRISACDYTDEFSGIVQVYNDSIKKLEEVHIMLEGAADRDGLTGCYNRRAFDKHVELLHTKVESNSLQQVGMMFLDLDSFKSLNDTQGHLIGDDVLKEFASILICVAGAQSVFRFGGDEFAVILQDIPAETIVSMAEEIRWRSESSLNGCTTSIGIAIYPNHTDSIDELLSLADKALYASKESKNKVSYL
jgi:diguanylate cyclase (GGDEF)-like protein